MPEPTRSGDTLRSRNIGAHIPGTRTARRARGKGGPYVAAVMIAFALATIACAAVLVILVWAILRSFERPADSEARSTMSNPWSQGATHSRQESGPTGFLLVVATVEVTIALAFAAVALMR